MSSTYTDKHGYKRYADSKKLVHRHIAYKAIYQQNRDKYPLPFREYQVHHKDEHKKNNRVSNLQIVRRVQHEAIHGIVGGRTIIKILYWCITAFIGFFGLLKVFVFLDFESEVFVWIAAAGGLMVIALFFVEDAGSSVKSRARAKIALSIVLSIIGATFLFMGLTNFGWSDRTLSILFGIFYILVVWFMLKDL